MRRNQQLQSPTFAQTVVIVQTTPTYPGEDFPSRLDAIKRRHLALGFHYQGEQIYRALQAIGHVPRSNKPSGRST